MTARHENGGRAAALAAHLSGLDGVDPGWAAAFAHVPRHVFVPAFYPTLDTDGTNPPQLFDGAGPADRQQWLDAIYRDESLITRCALTPGTTDLWQSTSSSTRPSLMARMLTLLDAAPRSADSDPIRVLEVGTGTGYNTALLSRRLGAENVASIDLDPTLVDLARTRLTGLGHHPALAAGDGALGLGIHGPYHRILATCAVATIPPAWIEQLLPDGLVVADVRGGLASSLLVARHDGEGTVSGRFLAEPGNFMWLRRHLENPLRDGGAFVTHIDYDDARPTHTTLEPGLLHQPDFRFLLQLVAPSIERIWTSHRTGTPIVRIAAADGAWAELDPTAHTALQGGPTDLITDIEAAAALWQQYGRPHPARLGITDGADGRTVWLDSPEHPLPAIVGGSFRQRESAG
ncbi:MAG: methyltransferase domain-containing protein [Pseudonocardia sp.]